MNDQGIIGCTSCIGFIVWLLLKVWAIYYIVNDVLIEIVNGNYIGVGKIIWSVFLIMFIFSKFKFEIKTNRK